jgi:glycosyltransferase involved in cell wall biosynthesis
MQTAKIGIDARLWSQTGVGRIIRNLVLYLRELDKKNSYVLFVNPADSESLIPLPPNWKIVKTGIHWHSMSEQVRLPGVIYREQVDLMHFPYFSIPFLYNKPYVVTIHDLINDHFPTGRVSTLPYPFFALKYKGYQLIMRHSAKQAKKILTVSLATKNEIIRHIHVPPEKIIVTYPGVDRIPVRKKTDEKIELPGQYFLYVGNVYPHKNADKLVSAFSHLSRKKENVKLVFVGREDYFYRRLKDYIATLQLSKYVCFAGYLTDEQLSMYYRNAEAVVIPSRMEGFGLPALEAMANGALVLASRIPSLVEVCGDAPVYFNPMDTLDITAKMEEVLDNRIKKMQQIEIGLRIAGGYSWQRMAEQTLEVYNACINESQEKRSSGGAGL